MNLGLQKTVLRQSNLKEGDIVNLDVSIFYKGFHSDLNETFFIGDCDEESQRLVRTNSMTMQLKMIQNAWIQVQFHEISSEISSKCEGKIRKM